MNKDLDSPPSGGSSGRRIARSTAIRLVASTALVIGAMTLPGVLSRVLAAHPFAVTAYPAFRPSVVHDNSSGPLSGTSMPVAEIWSVDPVVVGEARTVVSVTLRSGPGTSHAILRNVSPGSAVNVSNTVQNGFRYVVHQGLAGWVAEQHLSWGAHQAPSETFTTTANLNLRADPSLSAKVLLVMPAGSTVAGLDDWSNTFRKVSYKGTVGWAATCYLHSVTS